MKTNVTDTDHKREGIIFNLVEGNIPEFEGIEFKHLEEETAIYDFEGYKNNEVVIKADVKCENIRVNQYDRYLVSKEKVWLSNSEQDKQHFIIYSFIDSWVRVFDLEYCDPVYEDFTFTHKRTGKRITQKVYKILARYFNYEFYIEPEIAS